jgi:hypothetical protein
LREWCRLGKTDTVYIEPGSPWQNPYVESFNARMRDELLNVEVFTCPEESRVLAADWRTGYNANHPHSALGMMSPERFAASLRSPSGLATRGGDQERYSTQTNPGLSLGWTDERGPATPARSSAFLAALATPVSASSASPNGGATYTTTSSGRRFARHPRRSANLALRATVVAPTRASTCGTSLKIFIGFCV